MYSAITSFCGLDSTTAGTTYFFPIATYNSNGWNSLPESYYQHVIPADFDLVSFSAKLGTAPGTGNTRTITVRKNGADTGITLTFGATDTFLTDNTHSTHFAAGDLITLKQTLTGTPAITNYAFRSLCSSTGGANQILMSSALQTGISNTASYYFNPMFSSRGTTTQADNQFRMPVAGTISNLYVRLDLAPGTGNLWAFSVKKNGADTTVANVGIGGSSTTGNSGSASFTVAAGDLINIKSDIAGTPTNPARPSFGLVFTPTDGITSVYGDINSGAPSTSAVNYSNITGANNGWNGSADNEAKGMLGPCTITDLLVAVTTGTGAGGSYLYTLRKQLADTSATLTIDNTHSSVAIKPNITYQDGDYLSASVLPSGTPVAINGVYSSIGVRFGVGGTGFLPMMM